MTDTDLLYERRGPTALITFNRPDARNSMTFAMYEELHRRCDEADADEGVRVLVLRGAGDKAFVAGTDISQFREFRTPSDAIAYEERIDRTVGRLELVGKPTIALVDGYAVGAGLALAAACDLRVCTPDAQFGMPIARTLGNCLSMANYARLVALVGPARTKELMFTARLVSAQEALDAGLVTQVVPAEDVEGRVAELAELLARHAPLTLRATKEAIRRIREAGLPSGEDLVLEAYGSNDFREGVASFLEKRKPVWTGS
jgi:enoyl-CoA hydratase/carnithine racemase